jgi:hypothetical protein
MAKFGSRLSMLLDVKSSGDKAGDICKVSIWAKACFILHTFSLIYPDGIEWEYAEDNWY